MIPISYIRDTAPAGPMAIDYGSAQAKGLIGFWPFLSNDSSMVSRNLVRQLPGVTTGDLKWQNTTTGNKKSTYQYGSASIMPGSTTNYWKATGSFPGGNVTLSIRAKFNAISTGTTQNNELFERDSDASSWGVQFQLAGPKPIFYIVNHVPAALSLTANSSLVINTWYHLVASYNLTTNIAKVYIDGRLDNSATLSATSIRGTGGTYTVGATEGNARHVNGFLADARIYNRALTDAEVRDVYRNPTAVFDNKRVVTPFSVGGVPQFNASQFFMVM